MDDEVKISGFKDLYQFFMTVKARKCSFYISFGDAADQTLADYRLQEVVYKTAKMKRPSNSDVTLVLEPLSRSIWLLQGVTHNGSWLDSRNYRTNPSSSWLAC